MRSREFCDDTVQIKRAKKLCEVDIIDDRISDLPDSVLCYILSFLPTIFSVRTSVLSKRFKGLWTKVPNLYFEQEDDTFGQCTENFQNHVRFGQFVDRVLLLHNTPINKFYLQWQFCPRSYFDSWISTAISRNLRHLDLQVLSFGRLILPDSLFTCKTLEFLEVGQEIAINPPSFVCLPRLQTLILFCVSFQDEESFCNLVQGCSMLQSLSVRRDEYDNISTFTVSSPSLRSLALHFEDEVGNFPPDLPCKLEINAPSLEYLGIFDCVSEDFRFQSLTSLIEAEIYVILDTDDAEDEAPSNYIDPAAQLVYGLSNARCLTLGCGTMQPFGKKSFELSSKFQRITKLVVIDQCHLWCSLQDLLESSVNLEVLEFQKISCDGALVDDPPCSSLTRVPSCLLSSLREISLVDFDGCDHDFAMIRHYLKDAKVLEKVNLYVSKNSCLEGELEMLKRISTFCRQSPTCEINLLESSSIKLRRRRQLHDISH